MPFFDSFFSFFIDNFPPLSLISWLFPLSIIWSFAALYIAGVCKKNLGWATGYSRKVFHFLIFISALFYQQSYSVAGVFILGWSVSIVLLYSIFKGEGSLLYEAIAREKDAPHRTKYIVYSYVATLLGGILSNFFLQPFAIFGYVVTGFADAIAEPIGTRWGKHTYKVFSFDKNKKSYRSMEGSIAVFVATFFSIYAVTYFTTTIHLNILYLAVVAFLCTLAEAVSPSGFDNFILQIVTTFLCSFLFYYS
ncbi:MAG TPA: hypothetical protein PKM51_05810 [Chitinophagales bacterium]|nr:hypothetical protein [Chitinophagales bacterium]